MQTMDSYRWASYHSEQKVDADLVILPQIEQVSRGQELMSLLLPEAENTPMPNKEKKMDAARIGDIDWDVIVQRGFIQVVIPPCRAAMRRSLSDSALLPRRYDKADQQWKCLVGDKLDMSDASTNISIEAEDHGYSSEDGEAEVEQAVQPAMPYQYMESWWLPMGYDATSTGFDQSAMGYDQTAMVYDPASISMGYDLPASFNPSAASFVPMQWADQSIVEEDAEGQEWRTTVMIRNMPNNYTREMLLELVDDMGFSGSYDFAYLPVDFQSQAGLGYAFINFVSVADAQLCFEQFEGFSNWKVPSEKVCTVTWSSPAQGFEQHIERYKNSPVMHPSLPDEWKPVLFQQGMRVAFPPPTKPIKTPKVRQHPSAKTA